MAYGELRNGLSAYNVFASVERTAINTVLDVALFVVAYGELRNCLSAYNVFAGIERPAINTVLDVALFVVAYFCDKW